MSFLDEILKFAPSYWEPASYKNLKYVGKDANCSAEGLETFCYNHFRSFHTNFKITKITTIQHPFAFGNFLLYKQQLETRNKCRYEEELRYLYVKDENMLSTILNYNCDLRRGGFILLQNDFSNFEVSSQWFCILVRTRRIKTENFLQGNASGWYPEFVIKLQIRGLSVPKVIPPPAASKLQPYQLKVVAVKPQVPSTAFKSSSVSQPKIGSPVPKSAPNFAASTSSSTSQPEYDSQSYYSSPVNYYSRPNYSPEPEPQPAEGSFWVKAAGIGAAIAFAYFFKR